MCVCTRALACMFVGGVNFPCTIEGLSVGSTWFGPRGSLEPDGKTLRAADGDAAKLSKAGTGTVRVNTAQERTIASRACGKQEESRRFQDP